MGLDQYGESYNDDESESNTLMTWRKHNRLQGYMAELAMDRGLVSQAEEFNSGIDLELDLGDIENLEHCVVKRLLPEAQGFFFGDDSYNEGYEEFDLKSDLKFIRLAKDALNKGYTVTYGCWW